MRTTNMAMHDEIKEQKSKLKGKPFNVKLAYFREYYKVHTIIALLTVIVIGIFVHDALTAKEQAFSATLLNAYAGDSQDAVQIEFGGYADIDPGVYECYIDTASTLSYETMSQMDLAVSQRIIAMAQTGSIDVLISDAAPFTNFSEGMLFKDLREELSETEYGKFESSFYYIDAADLEDDEMQYDEDGSPLIVDTSIDHTDPSSMEDPVPVGISLTDCAKLKEFRCYTSTGEVPIFGFVYSSGRKDLSHQFLKYLTE